uniref:Amino acid transporter transmembrane domain-containing protein n=1 Tax=Aegilops tauschii subsp. strangulata TaxID=200361 RepID=A0A453FYT5_AEGTS
MVCFGAVVASTLLAGQSMKAIYLIASPGGAIKLYVFVAIFGVFLVVLAQLPSFHSLRHVNLVSLLLCLSYSLCAVAGCVYLGTSDRPPPKDYSIVGNTHARVYGVFNALAVIATTYGNGIIPEIQVTERLNDPWLLTIHKYLHYIYLLCMAILGDGGRAGDGEDVQGPVPVLRGGGDHLLQRGHGGVLGVRQRGAGPAAQQLHGGRQARHPGVAAAHGGALHAGAAVGHGHRVPAADQRGAGGPPVGPQGRAVRGAERGAAARVPHLGRRLRHHHRRHDTLLRRHERAHRGLRLHAARLRRAGALLQPHLQALQEGLRLLAQHGHRRRVLRGRRRRVRGRRQADRAGRRHVQALR